MNNVLTLNPLLRHSVGFDRFSDLFDSALNSEESASNYPPYNIEKRGDDHYTITMAIAGFSEDDLNIIFQNEMLIVSGRTENTEDSDDVEFLHRGIATRAFERSFRLADHMKVNDAEMRDGLLSIRLEREVPDEAKPRMIPIKGTRALEADNNNKKKRK